MIARPLNIGERVYYTGDVANQPAHLEVVSVITRADGLYYNLDERAEENRRLFMLVADRHIGRAYFGHCDPRFVTEEARETYRAAQVAAVHAAIEREFGEQP